MEGRAGHARQAGLAVLTSGLVLVGANGSSAQPGGPGPAGFPTAVSPIDEPYDPVGPTDIVSTPGARGTNQRPFRFRAELWTANDQFAGLSADRGATASFGLSLAWARDVGGATEGIELRLSQAQFTEFGGPLRTDLVEASLRYQRRTPVRSSAIDRVTWGFLAGVSGDGNWGGAIIQDTMHALLAGSPWKGQRLGEGLPDKYTAERRTALLLGADVEVEADVGDLFVLAQGAKARAPIGGAGVGQVGTHVAATVGGTAGVVMQAGVELSWQWLGHESAMGFVGAPVAGLVLIPRLALGWWQRRWSLGVEWQRNHRGTRSTLGGRQSDSVTLSLGLGFGQR